MLAKFVFWFIDLRLCKLCKFCYLYKTSILHQVRLASENWELCRVKLDVKQRVKLLMCHEKCDRLTKLELWRSTLTWKWKKIHSYYFQSKYMTDASVKWCEFVLFWVRLVNDEICNVVVCREQEILHHDDDLECFYSSFVALATHYLCLGIGSCMSDCFTLYCLSLSCIILFVMCDIAASEKQC